MRSQALIQIILVVLSFVMIFAIIRPMFANVREDQVEVQRLREAVNAADQFNARLTELRQRADSFNSQHLAALDLYLPAEIDRLAVARDIVEIAERNQLLIKSVKEIASDEVMRETDIVPQDTIDTGMDDLGLEGTDGYTPQITLAEEAERSVVSHRFTLNATGTYEQMKQMLRDIEQNAYPLRLVTLEFDTESSTSILSFEVILETYALNFE